MVSIMVTMIMMIVISLIVLGFAQVSRREGAQALDRQLSTQAFLAAESGINDARLIIKQRLVDNKPIEEKSSCPPDTNYPTSSIIDNTHNVSYTCLLVTTHVKDVNGQLSANGDPMVFPIEPANGAVVQTLRVTWNAASMPVTNTVGKCNKPAGSYLTSGTGGNWTCPFGVLRLDIVPTDNLSRGALSAGQHTMFLYPKSGGGIATQPYVSSNAASPVMNCTDSGGCKIDITGLSGGTTYAIKLSALYNGGTFTVSALNNGTPLELQNAQVQIDATGRAQDVLRRIQVRLPLADAASVPDGALMSGSSICKHFQYGNDVFSIPGNFQPTATSQDQRNPTCVPVTVGTSTAPCGVPHDIILALDTSKSMIINNWGNGTRRDQLHVIAKSFVQKTNVGIYNHESIIGFAGDVTAYLPFSSDVPTLLNFINGLPTLSGTDYHPPLLKTQDVFNTTGRPGVAQILVFISDGEDQTGNAVMDIALAKSMQPNMTIYTVGINPNNSLLLTLQNMATPGDYTSAANPIDLQNTMDSIAASVTCN